MVYDRLRTTWKPTTFAPLRAWRNSEFTNAITHTYATGYKHDCEIISQKHLPAADHSFTILIFTVKIYVSPDKTSMFFIGECKREIFFFVKRERIAISWYIFKYKRESKTREIFLFLISETLLLSCSSWMRLRMLVDPNGKVPVKVVARTFASGKTEKLVYQCLADLGLSSGKVCIL